MYYARATRHKRSEHLRDKRRSVAFIKLVATWTDISRNVACPRPVRHYYGSIVPAASSQGVYHGAINRCISDFNISSSFSCQSRLLATKMEGMAKFPVSAGAPARNVIRDGVAQAPPSTPNPKSRRYRTTRTLLLHELRSARAKDLMTPGLNLSKECMTGLFEFITFFMSRTCASVNAIFQSGESKMNDGIPVSNFKLATGMTNVTSRSIRYRATHLIVNTNAIHSRTGSGYCCAICSR
jgi:hypothetical protein